MYLTVLLFFLSTVLLFLAAFYFGKKLVFNEVAYGTGNDTKAKKSEKIWKYYCVLSVLLICFIASVHPGFAFHTLFFLHYIILLSGLISIVDVFTHNLYLEQLPLLLFFIPIGCISFGIQNSVYGLLAGLCLNGAIVLLELILRGRKSYGGGDFMFGTLSSALIGIQYVYYYWIIVSFFMIVWFIFFLVKDSITHRRLHFENRMVPLLPLLSISMIITYVAAAARYLPPIIGE